MESLKIGILCNSENGSPKVLAETLFEFIRNTKNEPEIFYESKALKRLLSAKKAGYNSLVWILYKLKNYTKDKRLFKNLKDKDAIILCDTTPHAFYNDSFNIRRFRDIINKKPILYYAVQYLENSPTQIEKLKAGGHDLLDRYDWHLSISPVTEIRNKPAPPWNQIGMYLKGASLKPTIKKEFYAVVDFVREGYESYREEQIKVLEELNISYLSLEKKYSMDEIREIYKSASIFFIQFPEAYGMPIAECLACGSYIATPDSCWAMSWRLNDNPKVHGQGELADCFIVYDDSEDLKLRLERIKKDYHVEETPKKVFNSFLENYRSFYEGDEDSLKDVLDRIKNNLIIK